MVELAGVGKVDGEKDWWIGEFIEYPVYTYIYIYGFNTSRFFPISFT